MKSISSLCGTFLFFIIVILYFSCRRVQGQSNTSNTSGALNTTTTTVVPTTTTVPTKECSSLHFHQNCYTNQSCNQFSGSCFTRCDLAPSASLCGASPHCVLAADGRTCNPKCYIITNSEYCVGSDGCSWYNGKCDVKCAAHMLDQSACGLDPKCWFDPVGYPPCRANCALAADAVQCVRLLRTSSCIWDSATSTCVRSCEDFSSSDCEKQPGCAWFIASASCMRNCSTYDKTTCANEKRCMLANGTCTIRCEMRSTQSDCAASSVCRYTQGSCGVGNCSAILDAASCGKEELKCQWDSRNSTCLMSCSAATAQTAVSAACPASPYCSYNSTARTCDSLACFAAFVEDDCIAKAACMWGGSTCMTKCESLNSDQCTANSKHCMMLSVMNTCFPKCSSFATQASCTAASKNECIWSGSRNTCFQRCSSLSHEASACTTFATGCTYRSGTRMQICTATCSLATTAAECNGPFFQDAYSCFWDSQAAACKTSCEYASIDGTCSSPCVADPSFAWCSLPRPTTPAPPAGIPRVQFTIETAANVSNNVTEAAFAALLAAALGIPVTSVSVTITASTSNETNTSGTIVVEFISGANAFSVATKALNLPPSVVGASATSSQAPLTSSPAPESGDPQVILLIGLTAGGATLLVIALVAVEKSKPRGKTTASRHGVDDGNGMDQPMLNLPQQQNGVQPFDVL